MFFVTEFFVSILREISHVVTATRQPSVQATTKSRQKGENRLTPRVTLSHVNLGGRGSSLLCTSYQLVCTNVSLCLGGTVKAHKRVSRGAVLWRQQLQQAPVSLPKAVSLCDSRVAVCRVRMGRKE